MDLLRELYPKFINPPSKATFERFCSKVGIRDDNRKCWLWLASKLCSGHGQFNKSLLDEESNRTPLAAHRALDKWLRGSLPAYWELDVSCGNRHCVNPGHVYRYPLDKPNSEFTERMQIFKEIYDLMKAPPSWEVYLQFINKINMTGWKDCWEWKGGLNKQGYGRYVLPKKDTGKKGLYRHSHRVLAEWIYGKFPANWDVDHITCSNPPCCNPLHLLPGTRRDNLVRPGSKSKAYVNSLKTHCPQGHLLQGDNLVKAESYRRCRICRNEQQNKRRLVWKEDLAKAQPKP